MITEICFVNILFNLICMRKSNIMTLLLSSFIKRNTLKHLRFICKAVPSVKAYFLARGGGGDSHMKQAGMLVGNFEFNP